MNNRGTMDIICDIDGTIANLAHRRKFVEHKPKDWKSFFREMEHDVPIWPVIDIVTDLDVVGYKIIFCSGRPDDYRDITEAWLEKYLGFHSPLYMRKSGDFRPDDVIKEELLNQMHKDGYYPSVVFDDRTRVVQMWRRRGLVCMQVADGDF